MNFPQKPDKLEPIDRPVDEITILSDDLAPDNSLVVYTDSDRSVSSPANLDYFVKCKTAEDAFITFVLHGTLYFRNLCAILKSGKLIQSATGIYGQGLYVRINSAAKWNTPVKDLGPLVGAFGPYFLVLSVAVLDKYDYAVNETGKPKITKESDLGSRFDQHAKAWPVRPNNIRIISEVSLVYLQKIWIGPAYSAELERELQTIWRGHRPAQEAPLSVKEVRQRFQSDPALAAYAGIVEPLPEVIEQKYFVRYCRDWQTPLYRINGAVVHIVDTESQEEKEAALKLSKCYVFNDYIQL